MCVWLQRGEDVRAEQGRPQARQDGHRVGAPAHLGRKTTHVTSILTSHNHSGGGEAREGAREDGPPRLGVWSSTSENVRFKCCILVRFRYETDPQYWTET